VISVWQKVVSLIISWVFGALGKDIRKREIFTVVVPSTGDQRVITYSFEQSQGLSSHLRCAVKELKLEDAVSQPL
jgi:hypothetical protein